MAKERKYFGTDGIRGRVGEGAITPEFMLKLGWAAGKVLGRQGKCKVIIGKDTRTSGYMLESALESGFASAGVDIRLTGPFPTPAVAHITRAFRAQAGVVISASHNLHYDNGIKFFSSEGYKLSDELELAIEEKMQKPMTVVPPDQVGKVSFVKDAPGRYIEFCKGTFPMTETLSGLNVVLDCANGATYNIAPYVFDELGARVTTISNQPDGVNINFNCGAVHPNALSERVLQEHADVGIAFDGDGDRVVMVDHKGEIVDGDELLFIIAQDRLQRGILDGGVVGTQMSNLGMELALNELNIPFTRSQVGDRYVLAEMQARDWLLGGENSGHIICGDMTTTGDAIISALQVLTVISETGRSLHELKQAMSKLPQVMINVKARAKLNLQDSAIQDAITTAERTLGPRGRVLIRPSGTEPVIRIMAEGEDKGIVETVVKELSHKLEKMLRA